MTATQKRPVYTGEFEAQLIQRVAHQYAPNLLAERQAEPRDSQTKAEREGLVDLYIWGASHDLFIAQLVARAIDRLFPDDLDILAVLARQLGDDGAHGASSRQRAAELAGRDPVDQIKKNVKAHWERVGEIATGSWQGFLAWEFHYEHYVQAKALARRNTSQIVDLGHRHYAEGRIIPDELVHRVEITDWWQKKFDAATRDQRAQWSAEILAADEALQKALNPYLHHARELLERGNKIDSRNLTPFYDNLRREFLAYHLDKTVGDLPALTSLSGDAAVAHAAE